MPTRVRPMTRSSITMEPSEAVESPLSAVSPEMQEKTSIISPEMQEKISIISPEMQEKIRVQFEFTPEALARLDALKTVTNAATRAEALRSALRLYEWFVNEAMSSKDVTIKSVDKKGKVLSQFKASLLLG